MKVATKIKERLAEKDEEAKQRWTAFAAERKKLVDAGIDPTSEEGKKAFDAVHESQKAYAEVAEEVKDLTAQLVAALEIDGIDDADRVTFDGKHFNVERNDDEAKLWTPGERLTKSDAYKELVESGELERTTRGSFKWAGGEIASREEFKTLITGLSRTSGGAFIVPDRQPGVVSLLLRPLVVRQLVTVGDTDVDLVEWVKENSFTNAAAETAEATATATGGTKPESGIDYAVVQSQVKNIAHWIPATKRALADIGQLRTLIDSRLQDGVNLRLDSQMINGDATGENLRGILNTSGILTQARGANPGLEAVLMAITQLRLAFVEPTAVLMHPTDAMNLRLAKNAQGAYYFGNPNIGDSFQIWGLPIVQTPAVPVGTSIVGKWDEAMLWVREGVNISASDSHNDFFIRNMVAVLAEGRFAFAIPRPFAFCTVTGL
jgi:HK97 family phage major capsid protein